MKRTFWCANFMELFERWAFYGVRGSFSIYLRNVLNFSHIQKGSIYSWWALIQTLLPMFTGGYADRYGYKLTIVIATILQVSAYVLLATQHSYAGVFVACMSVATATAIFKPGLQGTLAHALKEKNEGIGWGIFYMVVNIGGFIGPLVSGAVRQYSWTYLFIVSAVAVSCNFIILLFYPDPQRSISKDFTDENPLREFAKILVNSVRNIFEPRLITFLLLFSGFWLMFMQLFDILPNFIDDWVDTSRVVLFFGNIFGIQSWIEAGQKHWMIPAEWIINIDAGFIILAMVPISKISSRVPVLTSIIIGILIASVGLVLSGASMSGWLCILGIVIFAVGEMASSPKKLEYLSSLAPEGKKGLYLGYANIPLAIGWSIGSSFGGWVYENYADKLNFVRKVLASDFGITENLSSMKKEEAVQLLAEKLQISTLEVNQYLFDRFHPDRIWYLFAAIGIASMVGLIIYDHIIRSIDRAKKSSLGDLNHGRHQISN